MKKLLIILTVFLSGCYVEPEPCEPEQIPAKMIYNIQNNDRTFGSSPNVWDAGIEVQDSGKTYTILMTEFERQRFKERWEKNKTDTLK